MRPTLLQTALAGVSLAAITAGSASAGGFSVAEYSVRDLGQANAGYAAYAEDASTIWANPAGLAALEDFTVTTGAHYIIGRGEFIDQGSRGAAGGPLAGGEEDDLFEDTAVPNLYAALPIGDGRIVAGLGVSAPFGLATDYAPGSVTRYQSLESSLQVVDINPSFAVQVTDELSIGFGVSAQYADAELTNAVDFGALCLGQVEPTAPGTCAPLGLTPQMADGLATVEGDSWAWGANAGLRWTPAEGTHVGLSYRSEVSHELEGDADYDTPAAAAALFAPAFTDTPARADLDLPAEAAVSVSHAATGRLDLNASIVWKGWSSVDALAVDFENPAQPDTSEPLNYSDTIKVSAGAEYEWTPELTVRGGVAFDESPTDETFRSPRVPDSNRTIVAAGVSWTPAPDWTIDAGWQHLFFEDAPIDTTGPGGDRLLGETENAADIVSIGVSWRM